MAGTPAGSSAHGEQPKFTALLKEGEGLRHMLVKFSPPRATPLGQRWSDLLFAEHLAHQHLREHGIDACNSRVLEYADRTFLEIERFDRTASEGRRGVTSLLAVDTARYGQLDNWIAAAERMNAQGLISGDAMETIRLLSAFGELIGNTDRHFGNLSFYDRYDGKFGLAPIYDMLPMLFAPQSDQIVARELQPSGPSASTLQLWPRARQMAEVYWDRLRQHDGISREFIQISEHSLRALQALPRAGAFAAAN
jgi:serine/threonine protein kinase HipA of HipAB toxin-antitoxin module